MAKGKKRVRRVRTFPLMAVPVGANAIVRSGVPEAVSHMAQGNFYEALQAMEGRASFRNMASIAIPALMWGLFRRFVGPVQLYRGRSWRLTLF
ncbi:MAG: hypothetical protein DRI93_04435 [Aquificota bacterium]|nr:MAG: hypothetical protein DRI93_04435 [Aquificota bacterium]